MPQSQQAFSEPGLTTYSIQLVVATFPGVARQEHQLHDYFCKRTLILNANLQRKTDSEIHESDELLSHHQQLSCRLLEAPKARIFYVYGGPVRRWFEKAFNNKSIADERDHTTKYWAVHSVKIWDQVCIFSLF